MTLSLQTAITEEVTCAPAGCAAEQWRSLDFLVLLHQGKRTSKQTDYLCALLSVNG
jgi:hypothetical protein